MQIDQLFEFVYVLIDKKRATAKEMAARFGVSTRTIYRWLDALSLSGVPVYALKGRGGGIAIEESYTLDKRLFSEEERLAIVSSVKALGSLGGNFAGTAAAKVPKKFPAFPKTTRTGWKWTSRPGALKARKCGRFSRPCAIQS